MGSLLVDINNKADRDFAQNCAFPSNRYDELTVNTSGTVYTAPENGWFAVHGVQTAANGWFRLWCPINTISIWCQVPASNFVLGGYIPVSKGQQISLDYENFNFIYFNFIYAKGAE
jgi:hypothetical protein